MKIIPYIMFNGTTEAAFGFYKEVFNAEISSLQRYSESGMDYKPHMADKIMQATLQFEDNCIMAKDYDEDDNITPGNNVQLSIDIMQVFILEDIYNKLSAGGIVIMPLQDTFWGARFAIIKDKFGITWMLNCDLN
jgi:PhnB protein